jgi:hypothetical protein
VLSRGNTISNIAGVAMTRNNTFSIQTAPGCPSGNGDCPDYVVTEKFNDITVLNTPFFGPTECVDYEGGDLTLRADSAIYSAMPNFARIPFKEIGVGGSGETWPLTVLRSSGGKATIPTGPNRVCSVLEYGARADGVTLDTVAINKAINACKGGGTVVIPAGRRVVTMPFNLSSHQVLSVEGALLGPETPNTSAWPQLPHFPSYQLSRSGYWTRFAPLVGAFNVTNVTITGGGVIDGRGAWWWTNGVKIKVERPRLVEPMWVTGA